MKSQTGRVMSNSKFQELRWICYQYIEMNAYDDASSKTRIVAINAGLDKVTANYPALRVYLFDHITIPGASFEYLFAKGMPCGHNLFYKLRRKFFQCLFEALKEG